MLRWVLPEYIQDALPAEAALADALAAGTIAGAGLDAARAGGGEDGRNVRGVRYGTPGEVDGVVVEVGGPVFGELHR